MKAQLALLQGLVEDGAPRKRRKQAHPVLPPPPPAVPPPSIPRDLIHPPPMPLPVPQSLAAQSDGPGDLIPEFPEPPMELEPQFLPAQLAALEYIQAGPNPHVSEASKSAAPSLHIPAVAAPTTTPVLPLTPRNSLASSPVASSSVATLPRPTGSLTLSDSQAAAWDGMKQPKNGAMGGMDEVMFASNSYT
ncbi:hypothetical protein B0H11DRAFT_1934110 [Mycena galericulata]|nr:hypothetical protein B0H11DRAFT_1934110 [Mycena galericulata]